MTNVKAVIAHTYIGSLIYGCKWNDVEVLASQETEQFGKFTDMSVAIQKHNFPDVKIVGHRNQWLKPEEVPSDYKWFFAAFPPCSAGSMATKKENRGGLDNPKSAFKFTYETLKYAYSIRAPMIAIESVPGTYRELMSDIKAIRDQHGPEYGIAMVLENSSEHGCASTRKRFWHIQFRKDLFPDGIRWERGESKINTVANALEGVSDYGPSPRQMADYLRFKELIEIMPPGNYVNNYLRKTGQWDLIPEQYRHLIKTKTNGEQYIYYESVAAYKVDRNKPAPTITGSTLLFHDKEPRPLTSRELLRICGFPDTFTFPDSMKHNDHVTFIGKQATPGMCEWIVKNLKMNLEAVR